MRLSNFENGNPHKLIMLHARANLSLTEQHFCIFGQHPSIKLVFCDCFFVKRATWMS